MPAASLALFYAAIYTRLMRASMLEVAGQDYVRTARAKGISEAELNKVLDLGKMTKPGLEGPGGGG